MVLELLLREYHQQVVVRNLLRNGQVVVRVHRLVNQRNPLGFARDLLDADGEEVGLVWEKGYRGRRTLRGFPGKEV